MRIATDIGGTFTDLIVFDENQSSGSLKQIRAYKTDTIPDAFEKGVLTALTESEVDLSSVDILVHGTTVVINALTERKGAKTGLITTKGFRDVLEIARSNRPDLFNFNFVKQPPFVPRYLRLEVDERVNYKGEILKPINVADVAKAAKVFKKEQIESIAICCLHAYKNPKHELEIAEILSELLPDVPIICSNQVAREWREYERTSSTVLSAYVTPVTRTYLEKLTGELTQQGLEKAPFIMQSNGGIATIDVVSKNPISIVESGPASGILGAAELGKVIGRSEMLVLDIGGTTAKCSLIHRGALKITTNYKIDHSKTKAGYPIQTPVVEIVEIGNGGGSKAWVDKGGKLHVGPESAGANPGPAAYGKGGAHVTTTDANLLCGRIHPDFFIGGNIVPDKKSINDAFRKLQSQISASISKLSNAILDVANANMVNALKLISVNKGFDPRDFSLVVIGGGGAMHAAYLADELRVKEIIVPLNAGVFSAFGMLLSDLRRDYVRTQVSKVTNASLANFKSVFSDMKVEAIRNYKRDGYSKNKVVFQYFADLRYAGQEHYVKVELAPALRSKNQLQELINKFHKAHETKYTFRLDAPVEWVNYHLVAKVMMDKPVFPKLKRRANNRNPSIYDEKVVDFGKYGKVKAKVYERDSLAQGTVLSGPAIIAESATSTVLPPGFMLKVDDWGNLIINQSK